MSVSQMEADLLRENQTLRARIAEQDALLRQAEARAESEDEHEQARSLYDRLQQALARAEQAERERVEARAQLGGLRKKIDDALADAGTALLDAHAVLRALGDWPSLTQRTSDAWEALREAQEL